MAFAPAQGFGTNPVVLPEISDPTATLDTGYFYTNDIAGRTELMYLDDTGAEIQITSGGGINAGAADHGSLSGIADDDHTQYALLAGRSGGQLFIGSTDAGGNLILQSTAHATDGNIIFKTSSTTEGFRLNTSQQVLIGTSSPTGLELLKVAGDSVFVGDMQSSGALILDESATVPTTPGTGKGAFWVKNDVPSKPYFTDDTGADFELSTGAGNAFVQGGNAFGALAVFGTTDAFAISIVNAGIESLNISTSSVDSKRKLKASLVGTVGSPSVEIFDAGMGFYRPALNSLGFVSNSLEAFRINSAQQVIVGGASPTGLEKLKVFGDAVITGNLTGLDVTVMDESASVPGGAPGAGKGAFWVRSDIPSVPVFTDDAGTDFVLLSPWKKTGSVIHPNTVATDFVAIGTTSGASSALPLYVKVDNAGETTISCVNESSSSGAFASFAANSAANTIRMGMNGPNTILLSIPADTAFIKSNVGIYFQTDTATKLTFGTNDTFAFEVNTSQQVLIGTSTPTSLELLKVAGNVVFTGDLLIGDELEIDGNLNHDGTNVGFYGVAPTLQFAKIADPSGGATIDSEARTAINSIIDALEAIGISSSV